MRVSVPSREAWYPGNQAFPIKRYASSLLLVVNSMLSDVRRGTTGVKEIPGRRRRLFSCNMTVGRDALLMTSIHVRNGVSGLSSAIVLVRGTSVMRYFILNAP